VEVLQLIKAALNDADRLTPSRNPELLLFLFY
jgi:hypothetical protein